MSFLVHALPPHSFAPYFSMTEEELTRRRARVQVADARPGFPCRVSLADAEVGERVVLLHYVHQRRESPFRASHAIYVREGAEQVHLEPGELPSMLRTRLLSLRAFDARAMIVAADLVAGEGLEDALAGVLENPQVVDVHLHNAKLGCYLARATRERMA